MVAACWILFTDELAQSFFSDPEILTTVQIYKGWFYVLVTAAGLFYLLKIYENQLRTQEIKLENLVSDLKSEKELKDVLFDRIPVLINIYDPQLDTFFINREFEKISGWTNEEIQNIDFLKKSFPDSDTRKQVVSFMNDPEVGWQEFNLRTKAGDFIPISWTNIKLTDDTSVGIGINMTEIKSSQAKLKESQKLLRKTFESLKSSIFMVDPDSRTIIDCNSATEELFGYSRDELIGSSTEILHVDEDSYQHFDDMGVEALNEHGIFRTEYKMQRKDGTIFHSDHTVTLVYDEAGEVEKVISVVRDITEQKEYEQKLKTRQERLARSQKIGRIGDWEFDPETGDINWSPILFEISGRNPDKGAPSYKELLNTYFPEEKEKLARAVNNAITEGVAYDLDLQMNTDNGEVIYTRAIGRPVETEGQYGYKLLGTTQDITERKKYQKELENRTEFIETTLENLPIGVAVNSIDDGETTFINKRFTEIYGWPKEILRNVDAFFESVYPNEEYREKIKQQVLTDLASGDPERMSWNDIEITTQSGKKKVVNNKAIPLYEQNLMISTVVDVTEEKRMQEQVIKSVVEGEDRERKRIAHELHDGLGQYLVAANMNFQAMEREINKLNDKRKKQFQSGLSHLKKALSETRSIAYNLMPKTITDYGLIAALKNLISDLENSTEINFYFTCNEEELDLSNKVEITIYRILQEIISNAVRHAECSNIDIIIKKENNNLCLIVQDDGIGVELKPDHEEIGLGLRSIKTRVKNIKGSLHIESEAGEGMKTTVEIPDVDQL